MWLSLANWLQTFKKYYDNVINDLIAFNISIYILTHICLYVRTLHLGVSLSPLVKIKRASYF